MAATASFMEIRSKAAPISPSVMRFGKSLSIRSVKRKAINCKNSVTGPQIRISQIVTLDAIEKARGTARPIIAPANEAAAAELPARTKLISSYGVILI